MRRVAPGLLAAALAAVLLGSCTAAPDEPTGGAPTEDTSTSAPPDESSTVDGEQRFPDVLEAELTRSGEEFQISVTLSSPYDTPERYADGWRVLTPEGEVLAEHDLAHHHADEQPFTRSRGPFTIPDEVASVVVEGRDQEHGYGGNTVTVTVPR